MTFAEKIKWRGLNPDPSVDYAQWVDKANVKAMVASEFDCAATILSTNDPTQIDGAALPKTFVMKATHSWNMSLLVADGIVKGGNRTQEHAGQKATSALLQEVANGWLNSKEVKIRAKKERQYSLLNPGILVEEYINPVDYECQLLLFEGRFKFALVFYRGFHHTDVACQLYDENWTLLPPADDKLASYYAFESAPVPPPPSTMIEKLARMCRSIDHVRADFLVSGPTYYFSEFTFTHNAGSGPGFLGRHDADLGILWR